jgi:tetratricopeptide (TPR) repeat protein
MSPLTVSCPDCHKTLKINKPVAEGQRVKCPKCGSKFVPAAAEPKPFEDLFDPPAEAPPPPDTAPVPAAAADAAPPTVHRKAIVAAGAAALLIVAASVGAGVYFNRTVSEVTAVSNEEKVEGGFGQFASVPAIDPKAQERLALEKKRSEFKRLMVQGNSALAEQRLEDAAKAYDEALKLCPEDVDAAKILGETRAKIAAKEKEKLEAEKFAVEFARLMEEGKGLMTEKKYAQAVRSFETALQLMPADAAVNKALAEAKTALAADTEEKKKLADYEKYLAAGRAALVAERYADAVREFTAALTVMPNDAAAQEGRRQAEARLAAMKDDAKRRDAYIQMMKEGVAALKAKRYQDAVAAYEQALKLYPSDKDAQQGLVLAKKAMTDAEGTASALMMQADAAMRLARYDEAVRLYTQASQLAANNAALQIALQNAQQMLLNAQATQNVQAAYIQAMNQGNLAMRNKRFDDAVRNFTEAVRLVPTDPDANAALRNAQAALDKGLRNRQMYNDAMQAAQNNYRNQRYNDAIKNYQDALALFPNDPNALNGLRQTRYTQFMAQGDTDMRGKRYADAVRDYESALREVPGDLTAGRALAQAKALAKK